MRKKILLTGATGFLGSVLAKELIKYGYSVVSLKRQSSSTHRIRSILSAITFYNTEDLDYSLLFRENPDISAVIHTATNYGRGGESVSEIFDANIGFPLRLLDAACAAGVKTFINTDTILDKYLNIYSLSKSQFLQWGEFYVLRSDVQFINMRLEHIYGPGDDSWKFATYVINSCAKNVPNLKLTLGEQRRDFIHVDDVVSAYVLVLEKSNELLGTFIQFDVGSGSAVSIRDFANTVHRITNSNTRLLFGALPYREGEIMHSEADISALVKLGWRCRVSLEKGIQLTLNSMR
jgi:nucleoside-diphosphate-sugar epimerase